MTAKELWLVSFSIGKTSHALSMFLDIFLYSAMVIFLLVCSKSMAKISLHWHLTDVFQYYFGAGSEGHSLNGIETHKNKIS